MVFILSFLGYTTTVFFPSFPLLGNTWCRLKNNLFQKTRNGSNRSLLPFQNLKSFTNNFISRKKKANFDLNELPEKLIYHDLYLLYTYLKSKKIRFGQFNISSKKLTFNIESNNKNFNFNYDISSKKILHKINDSNFISKKNFINYMFLKLTNNRSNFDANHKRSLFALKLMEYIKKRICLKK